MKSPNCKIQLVTALFIAVFSVANALADATLPFSGFAASADGEAITGSVLGKAVLCDENGDSVWSSDGFASDCSEPQDAFEFESVDGFFSVAIGDTSLGMAPIEDEVITENGQLTLHFWFSDGSDNFERIGAVNVVIVPSALNATYLQGNLPEDFVRWDQSIPYENIDAFGNGGKTLTLGDSTVNDFATLAVNTAAASDPFIRFNATSGQWEFSNDGTTTSTIGTGAGSGDITSVVAGNGLTGGSATADATIDVGAGNGITVAANSIAVDQNVFFNWTNSHRYTLASGEFLSLDADDAPVTSTGQFNLSVAYGDTNGVEAHSITMTVNDGATAGNSYRASSITLNADDADADLYGLAIWGQERANAAAGSYVAGVYINNQETTVASMSDGILMHSPGVNNGITDGLDVSDPNITNSVNIGSNPIVTGNLGGTIGDVTTDSWTFLTDGTGDGEIVFPDNSIGSNEIIDGVVTSTDILDGTIATSDILDGTITSSDLSLSMNPSWTGIHTFGNDVYLTQGTNDQIRIDANTTNHLENPPFYLDAAFDEPATMITSGMALNVAANDGVTAGKDFLGASIELYADDADADLIGLRVATNDTANAAAGSYHAGVYVVNSEATAGAMPDAFLVESFGVANDIVDGLDVSHANITNAINAGANIITGTTASIDFSNFDVDDNGNITNVSSITMDGTLSSSYGGASFVMNNNTQFAIYGTNPHLSQDIMFINSDFGNILEGRAIDLNMTVSDGAVAGNDFYGQYININANDADADLFGLSIYGNDTVNGAAGSYVGMRIFNLEQTVASMVDGILIENWINDSITDAIDASDSDILNALNVGGNIITGTTATIDFTSFDVSDNGTLTHGGYEINTPQVYDVTAGGAACAASDTIIPTSSVLLLTTAGVANACVTISETDAVSGQRLTIINADPQNDNIDVDNVEDGVELNAGADIAMDQYDSIHLVYISQGGVSAWVQVGTESNNE